MSGAPQEEIVSENRSAGRPVAPHALDDEETEKITGGVGGLVKCPRCGARFETELARDEHRIACRSEGSDPPLFVG